MDFIKGRVFTEWIHVFMVFNEHESSVIREIWERESWKVNGGFTIDNFIIDLPSYSVRFLHPKYIAYHFFICHIFGTTKKSSKLCGELRREDKRLCGLIALAQY